MPYKKRVYKKRKPRLATKAYVDRQVAKDCDHKFVQTPLTTNFSSIGTTWVEKVLDDIDEGDDSNNRDGRDIDITGVELEGVLQCGDETNWLRIVLANFDSHSMTPLATNAVPYWSKLLKMGPTGKGLLKSYYNKYFTMVLGQDSEFRVIKIKKNFKTPLRVKYTSNDGETGQTKLVLGMISDSGVVAHPGFVAGYVILYFKE